MKSDFFYNIGAITQSVSDLQKIWSEIEGNYPPNYQNLSAGKARSMLDAIEVTKDKAVIEIGCNSGLYSVVMSNLALSVTGVDIDKSNIKRAERTFKFALSRGWCFNNVELICSNIVDVLKCDRQANCIVASLVLYYLSDSELIFLMDYIRRNINTLVVQCRPSRKKLVEGKVGFGNVSNTSLYNGLYDLPDNISFFRDCGFSDVQIYGLQSMANDEACPVIVGRKC